LPTHVPPRALAAAATERFPELAPAVLAAVEQYEALRYSASSDAKASTLRSAVQRVEFRLRQRRKELLLPTLTSVELEALQTLLPLYRRMPPALRQRTERLAASFLRSVPLTGCGGLVIDARMRALIAFQACALVATRDVSLFGSLRSVLVYPDEFVVDERDEDEDGVVTEGRRALSGQSEDDSRILLSWRDVLDGLEAADGYNVVLHEFAHYLDHLTGGEISAPGEDPWRASFGTAYESLCSAVEAGEDTLIDPYGAEDPAEFFAVCTETFFELPQALRSAHPEIYRALARFYGMDPAGWSA
jgi:MtfA peptidase